MNHHSKKKPLLTIALSSRALFDLDESNHVFETQGLDAYATYQIAHEKNILAPGVAFNLVKKLLSFKEPVEQTPLVEVILVSRNSADTGLRIFNSIKHYELPIHRAAFTQGKSPYHYLTAFGVHLFLSANPEDVKNALSAQCPAATIVSHPSTQSTSPELRIAFDGDAVLFSDEAERIYQTHGLEVFTENEIQQAHNPLEPGPLKNFLSALHHIQNYFPSTECLIRTALVTARAAPAHERVIRTLRAWQIRIDEALFLGGLNKGEFLKAFGADFYFDDQHGHCESTSQHVPTGHVPNGIVNDVATDYVQS